MRPKIKNSTILITGGAGFIGSHLVDQLIMKGAKQVIVVDNMFLGKRENLADSLSKGMVLYIDDAEIKSSLEYIVEKHQVDIVFNCATKALNYSFINPSNAFMTNVLVLKNLLELQRTRAFKTLCHFSSSEVYGSALYEPMDEQHPLNPTTTYAAGKAAADIMLQSYVKMFGLDAFIVRPFNNYGPRQNDQEPFSGVIPKTIFKLLNGEPPEIHGTGLQSRDYIYVTDTIDSIIKVYDKIKCGDCVNIAASDHITIKDLIEKVSKIFNYKGPILYKECRPADVACLNGSSQKIKSMIDFSPTDFDEGLLKTVNWYRKMYNKRKCS
jgi:UDP-glucose 4-epimerase